MRQVCINAKQYFTKVTKRVAYYTTKIESQGVEVPTFVISKVCLTLHKNQNNLQGVL